MKIGILGGGQLAQMLTAACHPFGIRTLCYDPTPDACAQQVTDVITAAYNDQTALRQFADAVDVITFETENIPLLAAQFLQPIKPLYPNAHALATTQDRLLEKDFLKQLEIPTVTYKNIACAADLKNFPFPAFLKTRRLGYDGKGQVYVKSHPRAQLAYPEFAGQALIAEEYMPFHRELSLIAVRNRKGEQAFYPLVLNQHRQGILHISTAPVQEPQLTEQARAIADKILQKLNYVGVLVIEFFELHDKLYVNELAPRVHNSGHWTIEGAACSQFEQHIRAICGLSLGSTEVTGFCGMLNFIGHLPEPKPIQGKAQVHYHAYQKAPRPKRKLGHATVTANTRNELNRSLKRLVEHYEAR